MSLELIFAALVYVTILGFIFGVAAHLADRHSNNRRSTYDDEDDYYGR